MLIPGCDTVLNSSTKPTIKTMEEPEPSELSIDQGEESGIPDFHDREPPQKTLANISELAAEQDPCKWGTLAGLATLAGEQV